MHDVRRGEHYAGKGLGELVWLLQISGGAPANHFIGGYTGAKSERQPAMYFPIGGGSLKDVRKPGSIVWSRVFVQDGALPADLVWAQSPACRKKKRNDAGVRQPYNGLSRMQPFDEVNRD